MYFVSLSQYVMFYHSGQGTKCTKSRAITQPKPQHMVVRNLTTPDPATNPTGR